MENFDIKSFALGVSSNSGGGYPEPTGTKNITENGIHNIKDYAEANVNVPVPPSPTGTINITENGTYDVTEKAEAKVNVVTPVPTPDIEALTVNANGTYTATECDGFSPVTVNVPIPTPDLEDITITQNGTYNHPNKDGYDEVTVNVPNTYTSSDEGKVVNNGALASQTSTTKTANGTYDTTLNNEVVVNVPQPSGNINITDMNSTDVSAYATAQVVDSDLVASNIKKDVNILGITGTYEGGGTLTKGVAISEPTSENYVYDIYGYGLNGDNPPKKEPSVSMYYHDQYHHAANTQSLTVNLHSNEITHIPANWMQQASSASYPTTVNLPNSITDIGGNAFMYNKGLTSITLPSSLTTIGSGAFSNTGLTSISIPSGVRTIGASAFYNCSSLSSIQFNTNSLLTIGNTTDDCSAFYGCSSLITLDLSGANIYFKTAYNHHSYAFNGCSALQSIIGTNIVDLTLEGRYMFNSTNLTNVDLQGDYLTIKYNGANANTYSPLMFNDCSSLTTIKFDFKEYNLCKRAISNSSITTVYLLGNEKGTSTIASDAFYNCTGLTDIYVGWSEGAVSGAPWGATNATIHYDWSN